MRKNELIDYLRKHGTNVISLGVLKIPYAIYNYSLGEPDIIGYVITEVEEGILMIPYDKVNPAIDGFEQLLPEKAKIADRNTLTAILDDMQSTISYVKSLQGSCHS